MSAGLVARMLVLAIWLPGMVLAYLPVRSHMRPAARTLATIGVPALLLLCAAAGLASLRLSIHARWFFPPLALVVGTAYVRSLALSRWKSVSVFLAVYAVFSCLGNIASAIDNLVNSGAISSDCTLLGAGCYFLLCCAFLLLAWWPATHGARTLVEDDSLAQTWYAFWILPLLFIGLNMLLHPTAPGILAHGRLNSMYLVVSLFLLAILCLFYALFYLMASSLNRNERLRQEIQFLTMQQERYDSLQATIEETRQFRHDLRHHFDVLSGFAARGEWEALAGYLADARGKIPDAGLILCENIAVDSVAGHYGALCQEEGIPFSCALDLPEELPVPEMDVCLVLANLLENAVEASRGVTAGRREIKVRARPHSAYMLLLTVENAFDGEVRERGGALLSTKRKGYGTGTQSVRRIVEQNDGYCRFTHEDGMFRANVMLRARR